MRLRETFDRSRSALQQSNGLGRLAASRLLALLSEGIHQAALGGVVLFAPQSHSTPAAIVGAFAVLLLPYSIVGPFAAAALDRWDRRIVIAVAAVVRTVAIVVSVILIAFGATTSASGLSVLFALSLLAIGLGRLINTGLTASMPRVVPDRLLATTNSVLVTVGSALTAVGAVVAFAALAIFGAGNAAVCWTLVPAVVTALAGAWTILALPPGHLGPLAHATDDPGRGPVVAVQAWRLFASGLAQGCRSAAASRLVWVSLTALSLGRAAFGITTLVAVLLLRESTGFEGPAVGGMSGFALLTTVVAAGMGVAAVIAPWAIARFSRIAVVAGGSFLAAIAQLLAGPPLDPVILVAGAFFIGVGSQVVKLVADNAMQTEIPDSERGGVFALQDALFNSVFVIGAAAVVPWVGPPGNTAWVMVFSAVLYATAAVLAGVVRVHRTRSARRR